MKSVSDFVREMKSKGYSSKSQARLKGKSGIMHDVNLFLQKKGEPSIVIMRSAGKDTTLEIIKAHLIGVDLGAAAYYVTGKNSDPDPVGEKLLKEYRIACLSPD